MITIAGDLVSIFALMLGCVTFMVVLTLTGMLWSGKLTLPGTNTRRVQRAANDAKIAQFNLEQAEAARLIRAEHLNLEIMEARGLEELQAIHDASFQRELTTKAGEDVTA